MSSDDDTDVEEDETRPSIWTRPMTTDRDIPAESLMSRSTTSTLHPFFVPQEDEVHSPGPDAPEEKQSSASPTLTLGELLRFHFDAKSNPSFRKCLLEHLCQVVPRLFTVADQPTDLLNPIFDDNLIQQDIFRDLETLLTGDKDVEFGEAIALTDVPTGNCGRVFKSGEATYTCRDCGADPTCVLCIECFSHSEHKNHRYKMSTSSGGGYCDCGDIEAWKNNASCSKHQAPTDSEGSSLPPDKEGRATWLIELMLHYADGVLSNHFAVNVSSIPIIGELQGARPAKFPKYSVVIYNDEIHTFEVVIYVLTRVFHMDQKTAEEFTHKIHTEGRAIVRSGKFEECARLKKEVIRTSQGSSGKPLRVDIRQSALVAHQHFAGHVLNWLTNILNLSSAYRQVFYNVITSADPGSRSLLQILLLEDTKSWKSVRELWHHLLIAGLLKEYKLKKEFAKVFADCYGDLMADFSEDDHDHIYSVTSLSVQILTVPTLAHYLVEEHGLFHGVMRAIMSEVEPRVVGGKVQYERRVPGIQLRRTLYALIDVKYLLTSTPNPWTLRLIQEFMFGFSSLVKFCRLIHESDPIVRQNERHIEYEPDWETAFNVSIKLSPVLTLIFDWCATNSDVCVKSYGKVIVELMALKKTTTLPVVVREVANHSATCFDYDIGHEPVSIYLALTRLFSGLTLALQGHGRYHWGKVNLKRIGPSPEFIMEAPLRAVTLVAQRNAMLWAKNGTSLFNQLYFYQSVRCRSEMYDKDILTLQIAATLIESNEFLIHMMNRLNVLNWMEEDYSQLVPDMAEVWQLLLEEFLFLVITLVAGRFLPGVGEVSKEDCIRKQIIQALCIGCMTHSELNRFLDEDVHGETGIESVVRDVANVKRMKHGDVFELKPEMYSEYDVFYYHYTREEHSKAEEAQRTRKVAFKEPVFFPPPKLPPLKEDFSILIKLLESDVLMSLFKLILQRCLMEECRIYSDAQLRKVLHLIGYGLNEELTHKDADELHFFQFSAALAKWQIIDLLTLTLDTGKVAHHKNMILWVITTYAKLRPSHPSALTAEELDQQQEEELRIRKEKAAAARARSMASISSLQDKFRTVNAELLGDDDASSPEEISENGQMVEKAVCLGKGRTPQTSQNETLHCILCKDTQDVSDQGAAAFVASCFIHRSTVLAQKSENRKKKDSIGIRPDLSVGIFIGACGHVMHKGCWKKHFENIVQKERRRPYRQHQLFDTNRNECLCPMCSCLLNAVLPVLPPVNTEISVDHAEQESSISQFEKWMDTVFFVYHQRQYALPQPQKPLTNEGRELARLCQVFWSPDKPTRSSQAPIQHHDDYEEFLSNMSYYTLRRLDFPLAEIITYEQFPQVKYKESLEALWSAVSFTITSVEMSHREQGVAFFGQDVPFSTALTLKYLTRLGGSVLRVPPTEEGVFLPPPSEFALDWISLIHEVPKMPLEEVDPFLLLVMGIYALPFVFTERRLSRGYNAPQVANVVNAYVFRLIFFLHMLQILSQEDTYALISNHQERWAAEVNTGNSRPSETDFSKFCRQIWSAGPIPIRWDEILHHLAERVTPFVSCCCKFFECYTGIDAVHFQPQGTPLRDMLKYLSLPGELEDFFTSKKLLTLGFRWAMSSGLGKTESIFPRKISKFYPLPNDYLDLMNAVADFACPTNRALGLGSRHPTICLLCGEILCAQSPCCQTTIDDGTTLGACNQHAKKCGFGTGIFLRIRDSKCFLLSTEQKKGAYVPPPYVDEYGETDQGLRRGNPLHLSQENIDFLRKLWINHWIPSEIVRVNERNAPVPSLIFADWTRI